ncbi:MAG: LysE family transporter, partial [Rubrobacteridae bacterium]|nr:LysE family transporter [Rubrobacteridae bacterium]
AGFFFGLNVVLKNPVVIRVIGVLGGSFLLWMSYGMIFDAYRGKISLDFKPNNESISFGPFLQGIVASISNPYWTLWWATIGASFVLRAIRDGYLALGSFYTGHILGDFAWYSLIAFIVVGGKQFITDRIYRGVIIACGVFLAFLGSTFILDIPLF